LTILVCGFAGYIAILCRVSSDDNRRHRFVWARRRPQFGKVGLEGGERCVRMGEILSLRLPVPYVPV
jgi:hypothetical protein